MGISRSMYGKSSSNHNKKRHQDRCTSRPVFWFLKNENRANDNSSDLYYKESQLVFTKTQSSMEEGQVVIVIVFLGTTIVIFHVPLFQQLYLNYIE